MDVLGLIKIGMFVPFFLLLLISVIVFLVRGYKKDLGKALISFIATIIAVCISLLLAKGISWLISRVLISNLPVDVNEMLSALGGLGSDFVHGIVEMILAYVIFGFVFSIALSVLKYVGGKIKINALEKISTGKNSTRAAAMGIRAVDAVVVTIMALLPLYGIITMVAPPASALLSVSQSAFNSPMYSASYEPQQPTNEMIATEALESVATHPVLTPYKYGPGAWVCSGISGFSVNGQRIDVATAANSVSGFLEHVQVCVEAYESGNEEAGLKALDDLIEYSRDDVINQRWSYNVFMALVSEVDTFFAMVDPSLAEDEELMSLVNQLELILTDMTFEEYTHNAEGVLDVATWGIGIYAKYESTPPSEEEMLMLESELYARLGDVLNYSDQAVGVKKILLQISAQVMYDAMPDITDPANADYYAAREGLPNSGKEFVDKFFGDGYVDEQYQTEEAFLFMSIIGNENVFDVAEAFARHPLFGADAVLGAIDDQMYIGTCEKYLYVDLTERGDSEDICDNFDDMLRKLESKQYNEPLSFSNDAYSYLTFDMGIEVQGNFYGASGYHSPANGFYAAEPVLSVTGAQQVAISGF